MREVLEEILTHAAGVDAGDARRDRALHEAVLDQHRPVQQPDRAQVRARAARRRRSAAAAAGGRAAGARFPLAGGRDARRCCSRGSSRCSSTRRVDPICTSKTPGPGRDILEASANNLYDGVTMARPRGVRRALRPQLAARPARRQARRGGLPGRRPIRPRDSRGSSRHLEAAIPWAPGSAGRGALRRWWRSTGPAKTPIAWRTTSPGCPPRTSPVDTINGFIEVYLDARGTKGAWEALVFYVNHEKTEAIRTLAREAQWFEDHMPWDPAYRQAGRHRDHRPTRSRSSSRRATPGR